MEIYEFLRIRQGQAFEQCCIHHAQAMLAPIPSVNMRMTVTVNQGELHSWRTA